MKRILIILLLFAGLSLQAKKVSGSVSCDGAGLQDVIVSDGFNFSKTAADGRFKLNLHKDARFVFVITPSGYVGDYSDGAVHFYLPVQGAKTFDFNLGKMPSGDDFTILSVSDPQMANKKHLKRFRGRPLGDLRGVAVKESAQRQSVGIALGDIAWNHLEMFESYKKAISTTGIPFYSVIGNHDFIQNRSGAAACETYENAFGPVNYAFFLGKDLVIGLRNIIFTASGLDDPSKSSKKFKEGYDEETLGFVRGLLPYIGKDVHVFIAQHSPFYPGTKGLIKNADQLLALLDGRQVDFLSGHTHYKMVTRLNDTMTDHNAAAIGGAWWSTDWCRDGTPRGYEIIRSIGGARTFSWHNLDYPDDFQVQFINIGHGIVHRNSILANAWEADDTWTCTWTEDGVAKGSLTLESDISASYTAEITAAFDGDATRIPGYKRPFCIRHYYVATPSQYAERATMTVTAPDGRSWTNEFDLRGGYVDLQAHRGGAGLMPENTFTSMRNALDLRINTLEFDLQISSDGKVVVSHDNYFHSRYAIRPDGSLVQKDEPKEYLYTMPYDSIARYEVGLRPVEVWPEQKKVSEHKPLASDLIDFTENYTREQGLSPVRYNIEIKSRTGKGEGTDWPGYKEFCDKCMPVLLSKNLGDRLVVQCFDVRALEYLHAHYPEVNLSYLTNEKGKEISVLLAKLSFTPRWWSPHFSVVTRENVAYCHALGIKVVPWTVDEPEDIKRIADTGVDAIISNYPDRLIDVLR